MGLEALTNQDEVKIPLHFQEVKIRVDVKTLLEGEDQITPSILFKTFPFNFMSSGTRIYGDFWIREDKMNSERKTPFWYGVTMYNLTSFYVSMKMHMTNGGEGKRYEMITDLTEPIINSENLLRSQIIKEKLPNNRKSAWISTKMFLNERTSNSHTSIKGEIIFYINPTMNDINKPNVKSFLNEELIHQVDQDKNFSLICKGKKFLFNKSLLSMISEVFCRMIQTSDSKEASTNSVEIIDFFPETIKSFQNVVFSKEGTKDVVLTPELLIFARKYFITPLAEKVKHKLMGSLTNENIFDIIKTAYLIDDDDMFSEASDYLLKNMAELESTEEWKFFGETHTACMNKALSYMSQ